MAKTQEKDLRAFLEFIGEIDESKVEFTDVPDLLAPYNGHILGVEHTRIYVNDPTLTSGRQRKPQELIQQEIIDKAHALFRQESSIPLWLTVTFEEPFNHRSSEVDDVASALAKAAKVAVTEGEDLAAGRQMMAAESWRFQRSGFPFPKGIKAFHYTVEDDTTYEVWGPSYGFAVPHLDVGGVGRVLSSKDHRVPEYRKRCDRVWLLIVTDLGMPSSHFTVDNDVIDHLFSTRFDRVFLLVDSNTTLIKLKLAP